MVAHAQAFHTLYHTDESVLLGAPTGSGKTISAELAMLRVFRAHPGMNVIYIAPLKASRFALSASLFFLCFKWPAAIAGYVLPECGKSCAGRLLQYAPPTVQDFPHSDAISVVGCAICPRGWWRIGC